MTPAERTLRGRMGAHTSWANTADPSARTKPGRDAFLARFEKQVDPDGTLPVEERKRRATSARKAYMQALAMKSRKTREAKARKAGEAAA
ncbi:hypothetical protein ACIBHX_01545 [Nonomuraea sp. NPDC050536]|uniref:hypothetical protein n=1 Tax=Nonomuraea sp. NPDC050536 TaxID=3364366 RepID=UPI0037C63537